MKLKFVVTISFLILLFGCFSPKKDKTIDLNLDFENFNGELPDQWEIIGTEGYRIFKDSIISKKGQYSVAIESIGNVNGFKGLNISIPGNYKGENIEVSGYIKTENVKNGFAGLLLRIDPKIAFNNMSDMEINGTNNWKQYKISHKLSPEKTEKIVIGALLVGSGKIWVDDITVKIDGKLLKDTKIELWGRKADYDNEFDAGSRVSIDKFDENVIRNLELLGKIWGFIKYYHPNIVSGNFNWDYELLRFLPNYLNVKSDIERDELLVSWIKKFGYLKKCKNCETSPTAKIKPEISWINCSNITIQLSRKLQEVYASRSNKNNHYISIASGIGNPIFKNEKSYIDMSYSDDGFKLLSLFRYWNMVQYFYPYKHLTDKNWSNILSEYIPIFIKAKSELEYELAVLRLIVEINDSHGILWDGFDKVEKNKGTLFSPLKTKFIDNKLIIKDYCKSDFKNETKLSFGDIITHIDGTPINKIIDSLKIYYPHSNKFSMLRDMSRDILRSNKNSIKIKYISSGQKKETETELFELKNLNAGCLFKISKNENGFYIKNKV